MQNNVIYIPSGHNLRPKDVIVTSPLSIAVLTTMSLLTGVFFALLMVVLIHRAQRVEYTVAPCDPTVEACR